MKNIYLIGLMGTGKTAVGQLLAQKLGLDFVDLDDVIEQKEGTSISLIFQQKGEPYFRKVEKEAVREISQKSDLVVGCGGGAVINQENLDHLKKTGTVICLEARPEVILNRTKEARHRPLLNVEDPEKKIEELLSQRAPFYAQAHFTIDTSRLSVEEVAQRIIDLLEKNSEKVS